MTSQFDADLPRPSGQLARADWPPFDTVIFDCDSTLVDVEGIDELARWQGQAAQVADLTRQAMDGEVPLEAVYGRRLEMLQPTREQMRRLARCYHEHLLPGAGQVVAALQASGRAVFIVSAGLAEAVTEFGIGLGLPPDHIKAVGTAYDQLSGRWWETWNHPLGRNPDERYLDHDGGPLTAGDGKAEIIRALRAPHPGRAMLVGDGVSDLEASGAVDLFVGFGGVAARERVRVAAPVFIHTASLASSLPLALALPPEAARASLPREYHAIYAEGLARLQAGEVTFMNDAARLGLLRRLAA